MQILLQGPSIRRPPLPERPPHLCSNNVTASRNDHDNSMEQTRLLKRPGARSRLLLCRGLMGARGCLGSQLPSGKSVRLPQNGGVVMCTKMSSLESRPRVLCSRPNTPGSASAARPARNACAHTHTHTLVVYNTVQYKQWVHTWSICQSNLQILQRKLQHRPGSDTNTPNTQHTHTHTGVEAREILAHRAAGWAHKGGARKP